MTLSVVDRIGYLQVKAYVEDLQMADKTCRKQVGKVKGVMIHVDSHSFSIDFVILDVKENPKIPLILRRTFMKTVMMLVDMDKGKVKVIIKYREIN